MQPLLSSSASVSGHLFQQELSDLVPPHHELRLLADRIDWDTLESSFHKHYSAEKGRHGISLRILIGLQFLKYMFNESDESVVKRLSENAAWQYFCGFQVYEIKQYCDATVKRRCRMGINYLSGTLCDIINALSAAVAYNARLLTRELIKKYA